MKSKSSLYDFLIQSFRLPGKVSASARAVMAEIIDSTVNPVDGGHLFEQATGYTPGAAPVLEDSSFISKEWAENNLGGGGGGPAGVAFLATEDITAYNCVTSTGKLADQTNNGHLGKVIGILAATVVNGFMGTAIGSGIITNSGWSWTVGSPIFLNGSFLTDTPPSSGWTQQIGTATASNKIDVCLGPCYGL